MINKLKSLLCIILLSISTQNVPMIAGSFATKLASYKTSTQSRKTDASGTAFSISEVAPMLYVAAGVIFGGFLVWKMSSLEKRAKKQDKKIRAIKKQQGELKEGQKKLAERFEEDIAKVHKEIDNVHEDIAYGIKTLHDDMSKTAPANLLKEMARVNAYLDKFHRMNMRLMQDTIKCLNGEFDNVAMASPVSSHTASTSSSGSRSPVESL